ncbi:hypothetical protein DL98DRAFT_652302 [Cadophora sp. DSE1049]|nr:hypothetical protein DL98DRAFT_652302 [Cadophora sp. DSE1049]
MNGSNGSTAPAILLDGDQPDSDPYNTVLLPVPSTMADLNEGLRDAINNRSFGVDVEEPDKSDFLWSVCWTSGTAVESRMYLRSDAELVDALVEMDRRGWMDVFVVNIVDMAG